MVIAYINSQYMHILLFHVTLTFFYPQKLNLSCSLTIIFSARLVCHLINSPRNENLNSLLRIKFFNILYIYI